MWSWLAAVYFDQLRGKRTQRSEHFIPDEYKSAHNFNGFTLQTLSKNAGISY